MVGQSATKFDDSDDEEGDVRERGDGEVLLLSSCAKAPPPSGGGDAGCGTVGVVKQVAVRTGVDDGGAAGGCRGIAGEDGKRARGQ
jgi:hypothetical protein